MTSSIFALRPTPTRAATLALLLALGGCSTIDNFFAGDRADYKLGSSRTQTLDVPPDLTQLTRENTRYLPQGGVVSANDAGKPAAAKGAASSALPSQPDVALSTLAGMKIERMGNQRWLLSPQAPDVLWPQLRKFWLDRGFTIDSENAATGTLDTGWNDGRTKLPGGGIKDALGQLLSGLTDSGLRDRYRMRLERSTTVPGATEVYLTHFGAKEEITGVQKDGTTWVNRDNDPGLEATMLSQIMVTLGASELASRAAVQAAAASAAASAPVAVAAGASGPAGSVHARALAGQAGAAIQIDDGFDRAWRRVGIALDHSGFTVEDRDRAQGLYFVRFVNAKEAAKDEPGFFTKMLNWTLRKDTTSPLGKYRISVKANGAGAMALVLNDQGQPDNSENGQRIAAILIDELK